VIPALLSSIFLFSINLRAEGALPFIDSTKFIEYFAPVVENLGKQQDSILLLGEVSIFGWDEDSNFIRADSGVHITFHDGKDYISVETEEDGLFYFPVFCSSTPGYIDFIDLIGFRYGALLIPTKGFGIEIDPFSNIAFAKGGVRVNRRNIDTPHENVIDDTMYQWGYEFSDSLFDIMQDFCELHSDHEYAPSAQSLFEDMQVKYIADSLINGKQFCEAKELLVEAVSSKPGSQYLMFSLIGFYMTWANEYFIQKDTAQVLNILRDCLRAGDDLGLHGRLLKLLMVGVIEEGRYKPPFVSSAGKCDFGDLIKMEIICDFVSMFVTESQLYAIKYTGYKDTYNFDKAEEICYEWLKKFPRDSLAYHCFIDFYNSISIVIDSQRIEKVIAVGKKMIKNRIDMDKGAYISLGDMCYGQERFREAVFFYETEPEILEHFCFHLGYYIVSLSRIGKIDKANEYFGKALKLSSNNTTSNWAKHHILIKSAINLKLFAVVDSLLDEANVKFDGSNLHYLKTEMAEQYFKTEEEDKCFQVLADVLEQDSTYSMAWDVLGDFYMQFTTYDSSVICYQKALNYARNEYVKIDLLLKLASLYLKTRNTGEVVVFLNDFLEEHENESLYKHYKERIRKWCEVNRAHDILDRLSPMLDP
jgi:tetratricopeptide (TPR) repeat protein